MGLNPRSPDRAYAATSSGLAKKERVSAMPSFRPGKLRLKELTIESDRPLTPSARFHWPMHGPHAFANTVAPRSSNVSINPSRFMV